jgi:hypothetical protein
LLLTLPEEVAAPESHDAANFSFDAKEKKMVSKFEYLKDRLLEFLGSIQDLILANNAEDKLMDVINIIEEQAALREQQSTKGGEGRYGSASGGMNLAVRDRINVFKESMSNSLSGSWHSSLARQMNSGRMDESNGSVVNVIRELERQKRPSNFADTPRFVSEPQKLDVEPEPHAPRPLADIKPHEPKTIQFVKAIHFFDRQKPSDLALKKGELIEVLRKAPTGWWTGKSMETGEVGNFPLNLVQILD